MEATSLLILILLATVGARNIPARIHDTSALPQEAVEDDYTVLGLVKSAVSVNEPELTSNIDVNGIETPEEDILKLTVLNISVEANSLDAKQETTVDVKRTTEKQEKEEEVVEHVEEVEKVTKHAKKDMINANEVKFQVRSNIGGDYCPGGTRVGSECWETQ